MREYNEDMANFFGGYTAQDDFQWEADLYEEDRSYDDDYGWEETI